MKNVTRLLSVLMAFVISVMTMGTIAVTDVSEVIAADYDVVLSLSADTSNVKAGDILSATMMIESNSGLAGLTARIHYDTDVLSLMSVEPAEGSAYAGAVLFPVADLLEDKTKTLDEAAAGIVGFSYGEAVSKTDTGKIMVAKFSVKQNAKPGESRIDFVYTDASDFNANKRSVNAAGMVFKVEASADVQPESDNAEEAKAAKEVTELVDGLLKGDEVKGIDEALAGEMKEAAEDYKTIKVVLRKNFINEAEVDTSDVGLIRAGLSEEQTIAGYYDVQLGVRIGSSEVGSISELNHDIALSLEIPSGLPVLEEGKFRKYSVVSIQDGSAEVLPATASDREITFTTHHFGTYAVVYEVTDGILGDTNGDGAVNIADALQISQYDAGLIELNSGQLALADVNGDGEANIADALMISQYDAGLITSIGAR